MVASGTGAVLEELAQALFDTLTQFCLSVPRARRRAGDLKELEFRTLSILETRERPLIACRINPQDKRKIDVALTPAGAAAFQEYQTARLRSVAALLAKLPEDDLEDLNRLLDKVRDLLVSPRPAR